MNTTYSKNNLENMVMHISPDTKCTKHTDGYYNYVFCVLDIQQNLHKRIF